jgi:hypothetical protein
MSYVRKVLFLCLTATVWMLTPSVGSADTTVLNENFEGIAGGSYFTGTTVGQFKLESGAVEVLAMNNEAGRCTGAGGSPTCINLAALPNTTFVSIAAFGPGTYDLFFDLAGSQQGQNPESTTIYFGDIVNFPISVAPIAGFSTHSFLGVTVATGMSNPLTFFESGVNGSGNLLDNVRLVKVDSVPEPATMTFFITGLAGLSAAMRKKQ